jgi:hypothetical protein
MDFDQFEHFRTWAAENYRLELYDTYQADRFGKSVLAYQFYCQDKLIFAGADIGVPQGQAVDGDETVVAVLHFLACKPGDTQAVSVSEQSIVVMEPAAYAAGLLVPLFELPNTVGRRRFIRNFDNGWYERLTEG